MFFFWLAIYNVLAAPQFPFTSNKYCWLLALASPVNDVVGNPVNNSTTRIKIPNSKRHLFLFLAY